MGKFPVLKIFSYIMVGLLLLSSAVQYNDPDGILWIGIYGTGALLTWLFVKNKLHWPIPGIMALAVLIGAGLLAYDVISHGSLDQVFGDSWQMQNLAQEKGREAGGLLIVGVWMLIIMFSIRNPSDRFKRSDDG